MQVATPGILLMHRADRTTPYQIGDGFSRTIIRDSDVKAMVQQLTQAGVARLTSELYWGNDRLQDALGYCAALRSS